MFIYRKPCTCTLNCKNINHKNVMKLCYERKNVTKMSLNVMKMTRNVTKHLYIEVYKYKSQNCHKTISITKKCYENVTKCYENGTKRNETLLYSSLKNTNHKNIMKVCLKRKNVTKCNKIPYILKNCLMNF